MQKIRMARGRLTSLIAKTKKSIVVETNNQSGTNPTRVRIGRFDDGLPVVHTLSKYDTRTCY